MLWVIFICSIFSVIVKFDAARILAVFPTPSISHQLVFRPVTQELARRGHNVIVITPDPVFPKGQSPTNLTEIDVHDISYNTWNEDLKKIAVGDKNDMETQTKMFLHLFITILEKQLLTKEIQELIRNKKLKFDLIFIEACVRPALIYSHIFKAPVIQLSSFGAMLDTNSIVGAPNHPLLQPVTIRQRLYNLTFWEKIRETYRQLKFVYINYEFENVENVALKKLFGPDTPTVSELFNNVDMVFLNVHPIWNDNSPVPPAVVYMGRLHQQPEKILPKDLQDLTEGSENGVIYLSFGTNVQSTVVPPHTVEIMVKVFSELPYDVIWKWDRDIPNKPNNIKLFNWLPQPDLLRHHKVKLFITQGGLQSIDEAITARVPLIGIPVIADQWVNVEKCVRLGIGKQLEMGGFTEDEFRNAIVTVIEDQSYRKNIVRLRAIMRDEPQTSLERAIWWTEYVLRHSGAKHLRSPAANMPWTQYYELKVVTVVFLCFIMIIATLISAMYYLQRYIFRKICLSLKVKTS